MSYSDCDLQIERLPGSGGTLTLLYHQALGVISASSMAKYFLSEPNNMQLSRHLDKIEYTAPRIVSGAYSSAFERNAEVHVTEIDGPEGAAVLTFTGRLCDMHGRYGDNMGYEICYRFEQDVITITLRCDADADFLFYAVSDAVSYSRMSERGVHHVESVHFVESVHSMDGINFAKKDGSKGYKGYNISASSVLECANERTWTPCGGFMSYPIKMHMRAGTEESLTISI